MNISFSSNREGFSDIFDPPTPAKDHVPEWYKQTTNFLREGLDENGVRAGTVKQCMPVIDAMTAGYMFTTQSDVYFGFNDDGSRNSTWSVIDFECVSSHSVAQLGEGRIPDEYENLVYKMVNPWIIRTPPGYSCLFMNPLWRFDSPFYAHSGIVDTDQYPQPINFPFWIRKGFSGLVPNGTPMVQIIPFKRDDWDSSVSSLVSEADRRNWARATRFSFNRYKRLWRQKKSWK
jgi:hypothetical protein